MRPSRTSDYAVRALIEITRYHPARRTARKIGAATDINHGSLSQVLAELVEEGLLVSVAGRAGGYTLARPPETITLLDIITATEGPIADEHCALTGGTCDATDPCAIHHVWALATTEFTGHLTSTTLADLAGAGSATNSAGPPA